MLPLEQGKGLVDQGQNIDTHRLDLLLHVDRLVELLNGFGEVLLVKQEFTVVVVNVRHIFKVLDRSSEGGHGGRNGAHLVLCYTQLDVGVDESPVKVNRLLVVLSGFRKLPEDEVELSTVVVDIRVILVVVDGDFKVIRSGVLVSCMSLVKIQKSCKKKKNREPTKFEVQAGTLDVALHQRWLQFDTLVKVSQSRQGVTFKVGEGSPQVKGQGFEFTQVSKLQSLFKGCGSLIITIASLLGHGKETLAQLTLARFLAQFGSLFKTLGKRAGAEALEVVGNKGWAGKLLALGLQNGLALVFRNLLQESFERVTANLVGETVHDAAGGEIEQGFAELSEVLVRNGSSVESFNVLVVHRERSRSVLDNLFPFRQYVVAGGTVGVENGVGLAQNGLSVQVNGVVVVLRTIGLVTSSLKLSSVCLLGL